MIDFDVINQIKESIGSLLSSYSKEIEGAMAEEGTVTVAMPIKIKQKNGKLDIEIGIGFIKERVKDAMAFTIDGQQEMFGDNGVTIDGQQEMFGDNGVTIEAKILSKVNETLKESGE